jgi:hypothetical protein
MEEISNTMTALPIDTKRYHVGHLQLAMIQYMECCREPWMDGYDRRASAEADRPVGVDKEHLRMPYIHQKANVSLFS